MWDRCIALQCRDGCTDTVVKADQQSVFKLACAKAKTTTLFVMVAYSEHGFQVELLLYVFNGDTYLNLSTLT
ncbi:MAG: hypothetical protein CVU39_07575 [Chloroflexi bacterium HGW-Chloroflexi-10]|nr:MAG: hypothetical protein CVU39_07575 [Chloroflexi bacterium HGW-Chloroflexi-10]